MNNTNISIGTSVFFSNRDSAGSVEEITDSAIRVKRGDQVIDIPFDRIDSQLSNQSRIILLPDSGLQHKTVEVRAEELHAEVREIERGRIRIDKTVERVPFSEDIELGTDVVDVQRVPGGEEFDEMPQPRHEGETLVIPVVEEVLVISRRYRVVEEIHVTRQREFHTEHIQEDLQREVADVKMIDVDKGDSE